jgi:DNA (cytosine-5)-methyltransferase 1
VDTTKKNTITHLSLCTGYEGIGKGLRRVLPNVREIAYVEIEAFAIANLVAKMETQQLDPAPIHTNLKEFPYREFRGQVDILSGGFPCQPFSQAGARKATEDPRHLFPYIAEGIRECQPRIVFLENVEGIISAKTTDGESVLRYVLRTLEGLGYKATAGIFSASEVGFPHQRKRVYILGVSDTISSGLRGGRSSEECRDEREGILSNEGERNEVRSETEGCSNTSSILGYSEGTRQSSSDDRSRQAQLGGTSSRNAQQSRFPARPNEPQYEWEAPRVVEVKPRLGGTAYGHTSRVDRLRLLGNGVVPQTAAKAFETLIKRVL